MLNMDHWLTYMEDIAAVMTLPGNILQIIK